MAFQEDPLSLWGMVMRDAEEEMASLNERIDRGLRSIIPLRSRLTKLQVFRSKLAILRKTIFEGEIHED